MSLSKFVENHCLESNARAPQGELTEGESTKPLAVVSPPELWAAERGRSQPKVDLDTCIAAMAMTAKDINLKYEEASEAGLAALVLC